MVMDQSSAATRQKLIEAAGHVFSVRGFHDATVREICLRAATNVAAVNYHFGDKLGLYTEVLKYSLMAHQEPAQNGSVALSDPQSALRALVGEWFERAREGGRPNWFPRIMAHEMAQPTPALDRVVEAIQPNYLRFSSLVGKLIGRAPTDAQTRMCVHSIVGQIVHYMQSRAMIARLWPEVDLNDAQQRRAIADHIVSFSLAGMEKLAAKKRCAGDARRGGTQ